MPVDFSHKTVVFLYSMTALSSSRSRQVQIFLGLDDVCYRGDPQFEPFLSHGEFALRQVSKCSGAFDRPQAVSMPLATLSTSSAIFCSNDCKRSFDFSTSSLDFATSLLAS